MTKQSIFFKVAQYSTGPTKFSLIEMSPRNFFESYLNQLAKIMIFYIMNSTNCTLETKSSVSDEAMDSQLV